MYRKGAASVRWIFTSLWQRKENVCVETRESSRWPKPRGWRARPASAPWSSGSCGSTWRTGLKERERRWGGNRVMGMNCKAVCWGKKNPKHYTHFSIDSFWYIHHWLVHHWLIHGVRLCQCGLIHMPTNTTVTGTYGIYTTFKGLRCTKATLWCNYVKKSQPAV